MYRLKCCPFCGEDAELEELQIHDNQEIVDFFKISCCNPDCEVTAVVEGYNKESIIKSWNTRPETWRKY